MAVNYADMSVSVAETKRLRERESADKQKIANAKQFLGSYADNLRYSKLTIKLIEKMKEIAFDAKSALSGELDEDPVVYDEIIKDQKNELTERLKRLERSISDVRAVIDAVPCIDMRCLLESHYIIGNNLMNIALDMNYSERTVSNIHHDALVTVADILAAKDAPAESAA
ncbi:hypothetical protein FACS1894120_6010 [Clostridia bacterium]|nr:hypothetical protein FACS1894120_6010 [Clostridia bacterium]